MTATVKNWAGISGLPIDNYFFFLQSDIADFQKFRLEDIPAKLANKRRLEILFHEIEVRKPVFILRL